MEGNSSQVSQWLIIQNVKTIEYILIIEYCTFNMKGFLNFPASREVAIIERGLQSFHDFSCIRFVKRSSQREYLKIQSLNG